ncbi:transmembrane protein 192 isoform X2 [Orussus abietinus]|nr:transmembrane protein 192 isoform X2 [Orussus abietinus]XP_012273785.1 transmembrane protein 192 isoform X2 [Orussus abietinus]
MDEGEGFEPVWSSEDQESFQKLNTVPIAIIPLVMGISLEITGIVLALCMEEQSKCDTYFILLYLHCVYWLVVMLADHALKSKHNTLRMAGYLDFYQSTYRHIRIPFFIVSLWNTTYLLLAAIFHHTHKTDYDMYCRSSKWITPVNYVLVFTSLELITIIVPVYIYYIKRVVRFNRMRLPPDVMCEEWLTSCTQDSYTGSGEVGYRPRGSNVNELLEKQADLIRYLKGHNDVLSAQMMLLSRE